MKKFFAGFATAVLCFLVAVLVLKELPNRGPKAKLLNFLYGEGDKLIKWIEGTKGDEAPAPDPPVVVRGGSLNFYSNWGKSKRWTSYPTSASTTMSDNIGSNSYPITLDDVYQCHNSGCSDFPTGGTTDDPVLITYKATDITSNWAIILTMRNVTGTSAPPRTVVLCSALASGTNSCPTSLSALPTTSVGANIFVDPGSQNTFSPPDDIDRPAKTYSHFKNSVNGCSDDASDCSKIDTIAVMKASTTDYYKCIAGACEINIGTPQ